MTFTKGVAKGLCAPSRFGFLYCIFNSLGRTRRPEAGQKHLVFRYPLYWTGIAELKGQAHSPAAFSWPDAGPSIGLK